MVEGARTDRTAVRLKIYGRVQGVWYRGWAIDQAQALGVDGWVRNCSDGSVEAVVAGPSDAVSQMIARCREGPSTAAVDDVHVKDTQDPGPIGFRQEPTR
jgi:acylphosphatase